MASSTPSSSLNFTQDKHHDTPIYQLLYAGENITSRFQDRLISIMLTDNRGFEADQLDIELDDSDGLIALPNRNARISVALGWKETGLIDKGSYTVDEVEHTGSPDRLTIRARSAALSIGLTTQRERSFHRKTVGAIVRTIAAQNKLTPTITATFDKQVIEHIDQINESDANLLSRLAHLFDAVATVKQNKLLFIQKGLATSATGHPLESITITRSNGDNHRFSIADRDSYTGVKALYSDKRKARKGEVIVGKNYPPTDTKGKKKPKKKQTKVARKDATTGLSPSKSSETEQVENFKVLRHIYANITNAKRAAKAEWQRVQRGAASFSMTLAYGRPELATESPVRLHGWKPEIDTATWIVTRVVHTLSDSGYTTAVELEVRAEEI